MGRPLRVAAGGIVYHMLNRANARLPIFQKDGDYEAFERIIQEALEHVPGMRLLTYCLMPNHWHLVVWPGADGELSDFGHWLTLTHTQRWHAHYRDVGAGHLYQGRFKSFPVQADEHFLTLCRYVERNPVRANLVARAEDWRWGGLWRRRDGVLAVGVHAFAVLWIFMRNSLCRGRWTAPRSDSTSDPGVKRARRQALDAIGIGSLAACSLTCSR